MKQIFIISILFLATSCNSEKTEEDSLFIDLSSEIVSPKGYIVSKISEALQIDGVADEASWQQASFSESFIDIEGVKIPTYDTKMKMLWDENYLYVYAELEEPHVWGNLRQRDTVIFYNNDFEVFISPSGTTNNYGEIEINSLGTVWDLMLDKPYRDHGKPNNHWNLDELKTAVRIEGTLNDHRDRDSLWSIEMAVPIDALLELGASFPEENEQWRINFSRVEWDFDIIDGRYDRKMDSTGKYLAEHNWVWSPQKVINMHEPEKWGYLQFTYDETAEGITFIKDEFQEIKQVAYALFRQTKSGNLKELLHEDYGTVKSLHVKYTGRDSLLATFYKTNLGFEYKIPAIESNKTFFISEAGILREIE